jgi:hypothetical protein
MPEQVLTLFVIPTRTYKYKWSEHSNVNTGFAVEIKPSLKLRK